MVVVRPSPTCQPRAARCLDDGAGVVQSRTEIDGPVFRVVVHSVDQIALDGFARERDVATQRNEVRIDQSGGESDLTCHPVDVLEVLGHHEDRTAVLPAEVGSP